MRDIPTGSVDMILCDLPYGTTACAWDSVIPFEPLWREYRRVTKPNAAIVLTAAQPFTTALIASNFDMFKYCWIWRKSRASNQTMAKTQPLRIHEDIVIFSKMSAHNMALQKMAYYPQGLQRVNKLTKQGQKISENLGEKRSRPSEYFQEWGNYPKSIIECSSEGNTIHPTQKPVALFEYLIRTYTNPGDTVLDNCAGSGTTAIAAINSDRGYICIEKDAEYYRRATERVNNHVGR
ncbi:modification DNA-methylase protein [Rhizobium phage RHph_Y52]|nr:modification DNA-methylase protein [Rhizobium phage RHph_Y21]QIG76717.1 modification DNA-methylase protein [Rhizobium phage RHph_Y52]